MSLAKPFLMLKAPLKSHVGDELVTETDRKEFDKGEKPWDDY